MMNGSKGKSGHPFTVTRLQTLRLCPHRYHLQYELGIRVGGTASLQGRILHAAVAGFLLGRGQTDMQSEIRKACQEKPIKQGELARVKELAQSFEKMMAPHIRRVLAVEEPVEVGIGHIKIVGRVDAVVETDEGMELWELKTGKRRGYLDVFPLGVYALGIKGLLGQVPDRWAYVRLGQEQAEVYMGGEDMTAGIIEEAEKTARKLLDLHLTDPNPGAWCRNCPYRRWCPAIRTQPEPLPTHQGWLWSEETVLAIPFRS